MKRTGSKLLRVARADSNRRSRCRVSTLALVMTAAIVSCGEATVVRPNVVLVTIDTLRSDALGAYGAEIATPALDRLAREGAVVEVAIAPSPETAPSHASLFTGRGVLQHGLSKNGLQLPSDLPTLAEAFLASGYHTAAFVSSFVLDPRFGWDRGFEHYDADLPERGATLPKNQAYPGAFWSEHEFGGFDRRAPTTNAAIGDWLEQARRPFFLFVHYYDPHAPYVAPPAFARATKSLPVDLSERALPGVPPATVRWLIRRYHAEVLFADAQLGRLARMLEAAAPGESTLLVVTSDHGEGLGQHGWFEHSAHLYDEQVRVPLLFHWPSHLPPGLRIRTPVALARVAPTLAELAGVPFPEASGATGLAEALSEGREPTEEPIIGHRRLYDPPLGEQRGEKWSVREGPWKYIRNSEAPDELYDLQSDPREKRNLYGERSDVTEHLSALLDRRLAAVIRTAPSPRLDEETRQGLEALGYAE